MATSSGSVSLAGIDGSILPSLIFFAMFFSAVEE
jgi:hypothetical protein